MFEDSTMKIWNKIHYEEWNCIGIPGHHISPCSLRRLSTQRNGLVLSQLWEVEKHKRIARDHPLAAMLFLLKTEMYFREMQKLSFHYLSAITFPNIDLSLIFDTLDNSLIETLSWLPRYSSAFPILSLCHRPPFHLIFVGSFPFSHI